MGGHAGQGTAHEQAGRASDHLYPQVLENVWVSDKKAAQNDPEVQAAAKAVAEVLGDTGRIVVRESGTDPLVRVMVEAPDHDTCQKYVDEVVNVICEKGYKVILSTFSYKKALPANWQSRDPVNYWLKYTRPGMALKCYPY